MRIQGDLATYEFSDLLQWLAQGNKTGILTVTDGSVEYQLGFDHGRVDMSSSSDPSQRLDTYLHRKGVIDDATLARAERLRDATKMMAGQVLVTLGAVSEAQLAQALREKTEEILCELLTWDHGTFEFEGGDRPESTMVPISLEVTKLLLESMHRLDQRRSGQPAPTPATSTAFMVDEASRPDTSADATQAIEGLALAEVLDPESPPEPATADADFTGELPSGELPHYAVMAQAPGPVRRVAPYVLVVLFSLTAGAFYLANTQASAEAVVFEAAGEPILFTQTSGPTSFRAAPAAVAPSSLTAAPVTEPATIAGSDSEEALRLRYEEELAELRRELAEARRQVQPTDRQRTAALDRPSDGELPADSIMRAAVSPPTLSEPPVSRVTRQVVPAAVEPPVTAPPVTAPPMLENDEPPAASLPTNTVRTFALVNPKLLARPAPPYPVAARRHGRGATVTVRVLIGADGTVEQVERVGPKAGMGFDRAAEDAARASTWQPGTRGGKPSAMWAELRFDFKP